jgi:hypothetical protein
VSVRRVEDITEALWGTLGSPSTVSELNQIETWRNQPIDGNHTYVFLDGAWPKRSWGDEVRNVSLLVAMGVNVEGFREVLAVAEGLKGKSLLFGLGQVFGTGGESRGVLSGGDMAAVHGAFLSERVGGSAED